MRQQSYWSADGEPPADLPFCFNQMSPEEFRERFPVDPGDVVTADELHERLLAELAKRGHLPPEVA